jgi:hypothetical protein
MEQEKVVQEKVPVRVQMLTSFDRCDSCGAQAYVSVMIHGTALLFCGHHYGQHETKLSVNPDILDERWALR